MRYWFAVLVMVFLGACGEKSPDAKEDKTAPAKSALSSLSKTIKMTAGDQQLMMVWDAKPDHTYDICQSKSPITDPANCRSAEGVTTLAEQDSPVILEELENDVKYYFVMIVTDRKGKTTVSEEITATPRQLKMSFNDTGIVYCPDDALPDKGCSGDNPGFPGQDGNYGRDSAYNDPEDGHAGFSFTKLGPKGEQLPADALEWSCI